MWLREIKFKVISELFKNCWTQLKEKTKSRAEHLEVCFVCSCIGVSEDREPASFPGSHRDLSTEVWFPGSFLVCSGIGLGNLSNRATSFNLKNSDLLLSQEIMLLKINVLGPGEWIITLFLRDWLAEFCKTCTVCLLKACLWGWINTEGLRSSHCNSQSIDLYLRFKEISICQDKTSCVHLVPY